MYYMAEHLNIMNIPAVNVHETRSKMMRKAHQSPNIIAKAPVSRNKTITDFPITRINMLHILYIMVTETSSDTISLPSHHIK